MSYTKIASSTTWRNPQLSTKTHAAFTTLMLGEGAETALSVLQSLFKGQEVVDRCAPVTGGINPIEVLDPVKTVIFACDGGSTSLSATKLAGKRLSGSHECRVMRSPRGMDWNDVLQQTNA